MAFTQPPVWRPFPEIPAGVQHLLVPKWCVPGGVTVAGGGVPDPVERTKDWIASFVFILGSYLQCPRTVLYLSPSFKVLYVKCNPLLMI
jgi:hypothetical protein